ncbi:MAG: FAD-binding protein, partial [Bdellovibrionales bacterium]|nr:FAD-binding protein [Bdellovibrionales bacterium]
METYDLLVLGGGAAGFAAAVTAKEQGASVAVLTLGVGATAVSSGAFDFGPSARGGLPSDFAARTRHNDWRTPYSKLLANPGVPPSPVEAQKIFLAIERALDFPLKMSWDKALVLPTSNGHWKPVYVAQAAQACIELYAAAGKKLAFAYHPSWRLMAQALCRQWEQHALTNFKLKVEILPAVLEALPAMADAPLSVIAVRLQRDAEFRERMLGSIAEVSQHVDGVLLPPLFWDVKPLSDLQLELKKPISECLGTVEAVPGKRLQDGIFAALERAQISVVRADQVRAEIEGGRVRGLQYWNTGDTDKKKLQAQRYV